jgi:hypothetical protein
MKAYIIKHCLAKGIIRELEATLCGEEYPGQIRSEDKADYWAPYFRGEGREWCSTITDAMAKAEEMKARKIASLKKQIKKLEGMAFIIINRTKTP